MRAGFDCVLFGGQAERVPANRMKDVEALCAFGTADDVGTGVTLRVADVQPGARRVGEHVERVKLRLRRIGTGAERVLLVPKGLPVRFNFGEVVVYALRGHRRKPATVKDSPAPSITAKRRTDFSRVRGKFLPGSHFMANKSRRLNQYFQQTRFVGENSPVDN